MAPRDEPSDETERLAPGDTLGAFEIVDFIAQGGMGSVYKARNRITGEVRALKVILPQFSKDASFIEMFVREIKASGAVEHLNLVRVFEPAMDRDMMFLPMEFLEGETLHARLRRNGKLDYTTMLEILVPVCNGVAAVHEKGVVHRDLKPANIFLARSSDGTEVPKVLDFGAARQDLSLMGAGVNEGQTKASTVIGTLPYMPIEQITGIKVDGRADQYALGVIAYQMLTGHRPFEDEVNEHGEKITGVHKLITGETPPPMADFGADVPESLEAQILKSLSKDRRDRFASVNAFVEALVNFQSVEHSVPRPVRVTRGESTPVADESEARTRAVRAPPVRAINTSVSSVVSARQIVPVSRPSRTGLMIGLAVVLIGAITSVVLLRFNKSSSSPATVPATTVPASTVAPQKTAETPVRANGVTNRPSPTVQTAVRVDHVDAAVHVIQTTEHTGNDAGVRPALPGSTHTPAESPRPRIRHGGSHTAHPPRCVPDPEHQIFC